MFNLSDYIFDGMEASLGEGAILYRCVSIQWSSRELIANGQGPISGNTSGRFHFAQQPTTYCANNILTAVAEVLYHMYRSTLISLRAGQPVKHLELNVKRSLSLAIMRFSALSDLVALDSEDFRREHGAKLSGTMVVHPDCLYEVFQTVATRMRESEKSGIVYPSARHSEGYCFALFRDQTAKVLENQLLFLPLSLYLISEDQDRSVSAESCRPDKCKLDPIEGYYQFEAPETLEVFRRQGLLNPMELPQQGYVQFARRKFDDYPKMAVKCPQGS